MGEGFELHMGDSLAKHGCCKRSKGKCGQHWPSLVGKLDTATGFLACMGFWERTFERESEESKQSVGSVPAPCGGLCQWLPVGLPAAVASAGL